MLRVLVACEFSGIVRDAFSKRGFYALSCDLRASESPGEHYRGDVFDVINDGWDLMIAHPPCQYLSFAGNRYWHAPCRREKREAAMEFFMALYDAPIEHVCIENPHGYPSQAFRSADQIVQPWFFGDSRHKRTCLWLRGLPELFWSQQPTFFGQATAVDRPSPVRMKNGRPVYETESMLGGRKARQINRSRFFPGVANAMAEQWGGYLESLTS